MEKVPQVAFIVDLMELKNHNLKTQSLSMQKDILVQSNTFYALLESLIALFMDKYKIPYEAIKQELIKRDIENYKQNGTK